VSGGCTRIELGRMPMDERHGHVNLGSCRQVHETRVWRRRIAGSENLAVARCSLDCCARESQSWWSSSSCVNYVQARGSGKQV